MLDGTASATARGVAALRLTFHREPADFGRPDDDQRLQADLAEGIEVPATPLVRYLQSRTRWFDRAVLDAVAAGVTQLVAVGAGYDGRSLRYARPGVRWFELDHPDTQADKLARLARLGIDTTGVAFAPADFAVDDVAAALAAVGHDPAAPTRFTCEGVSGYLPPEALRALLTALRGVAAPGSSLAVEISLVPEGERAEALRRSIQDQVASLGERLVTAVPRAELPDLLAGCGWALRTAVDPRGVDVTREPGNTAFVLADPD